MREKIKLFLTEYQREKLIALVLAIVIYTFAIDLREVSRTIPVKLNIIIAEDQVITSDPIENVEIKAKGSVFDFAGINEQNLVVTFNLSTKKPGKFTRSVDPSMISLGEKIQIEKIIPSEIVVKTAKRGDNDKKTSVRH